MLWTNIAWRELYLTKTQNDNIHITCPVTSFLKWETFGWTAVSDVSIWNEHNSLTSGNIPGPFYQFKQVSYT